MKPVHILLAEDNKGDTLLTKQAMADSNFAVTLRVVKHGKETIALDLHSKVAKRAILI